MRVRACILAGLFFGCCHCSPGLSVSGSAGPPFSPLCCQPLRFSFLSFRKGLWELCFNFYTFSPRGLQLPGQLIASDHFLSSEPPFQLPSRPPCRGQRGIINNCLNMCCGEGMPLQSNGERRGGGARGVGGAGGSRSSVVSTQKGQSFISPDAPAGAD